MEDKKIVFKYNDGIICLKLCSIKKIYSEKDVKRMLCNDELRYYKQKKNDKRKREVFWGRSLAKEAIMEIAKKKDMNAKAIRLSSGVLKNPLVKGEYSDYQVSISHSGGYAAAIAFPEELIIGLDVEERHQGREKSISNILTEKEKRLNVIDMEGDIFPLIMWTCKEALVKFLRTGLSASFDIMQIDSLKAKASGYITTFRYFPGIEAYSEVRNAYVYTIVYTTNLQLKKTISEKVRYHDE